eukprot:396196_1
MSSGTSLESKTSNDYEPHTPLTRHTKRNSEESETFAVVDLWSKHGQTPILQNRRNRKENENANKITVHVLQYDHFKVLKRTFNELMNALERKLLYFAVFCTVCSGVLRLFLFIFIGSIIDLLADT